MIYIILDFEATCEQDDKPWKFPEIIEFPMVVIQNGAIIREFHEYVKPVINPILTQFCTALTGITQEKVENCDTFPVVLSRAISFIAQLQHDFPRDELKFITCGHWDLRTMMPKQCKYNKIAMPVVFKNYENIKDLFTNKYNTKPFGMKMMLEYLGIPLDGRHHSGIDDSRNIAKIMAAITYN
jgi:inhibitor of KinA sporulation pathway (predicted exonuclease)